MKTQEIIARFIADHYHMREAIPCGKCQSEAQSLLGGLTLPPTTYGVLKDRVADALRQAIDIGMRWEQNGNFNPEIKMLMQEVFG